MFPTLWCLTQSPGGMQKRGERQVGTNYRLLLDPWTTNLRRIMEGGGTFELMRLASEPLCPSRTDTLALHSQGDGIRRHCHSYLFKGLKE